MMRVVFFAILLPAVTIKAWVPSLPTHRPSLRLFYKEEGGGKNPAGDEEEEEEELLFYDDFGGATIGQSYIKDCTVRSSSISETLPSLESTVEHPKEDSLLERRIESLQQQRVEQQERTQRNWRVGNWQVRGFSLDPTSASADASNDGQGSSTVCLVVPSEHDGCIWVGRSDGSVVAVQLGTEYWTKFRSKLTAKEVEDTVRFESELVREEEEAQPSVSSEEGADDDMEPTTPFEIAHQFSAGMGAVSTLLAHDSYLFTATESSSDIQQWLLSDDRPPVATTKFTGSHESPLLCVQVVAQVLVSVAKDGSLALWDIDTGDVLSRCQTSLEVTSADSDGKHMFLGTAQGQVVAYSVHDLLEAASTGGSCPLECARFNVNSEEHAVTALQCGSDDILVTGTSQGRIQQWQIFARGNGRLEQWPKLPTQKLPKRAHWLQGHDQAISALAVLDNDRLLSASADGTLRAWNPVDGSQRFRMDGFTDLVHSLCLVNGDLLITDGMENFVCVHDFANAEEFGTDDDDYDSSAAADYLGSL